MKVFLNPGHTPQWQIDAGLDNDCGTYGNGLYENIIAAEVCELIAAESENFGIKIVDVYQSMNLKDITDVANSTDADIFVSVHCNGGSPSAKGAETFYCAGSVEGKKLAGYVQKNIVAELQMIDRGVKDDTQTQHSRIHVLRKSVMPAILIELGFLTNGDDAKKLRDNQIDFARAIVKGIAEYGGIIAENKKIGNYEKVAEKLKGANFNLERHTDAIKLMAILSGEECVNLLESACKNLGYPNLSYVDHSYFDGMLIHESLKILQKN